jgi:hypothetical protein
MNDSSLQSLAKLPQKHSLLHNGFVAPHLSLSLRLWQ